MIDAYVAFLLYFLLTLFFIIVLCVYIPLAYKAGLRKGFWAGVEDPKNERGEYIKRDFEKELRDLGA